jgi:hypothetical protein
MVEDLTLIQDFTELVLSVSVSLQCDGGADQPNSRKCSSKDEYTRPILNLNRGTILVDRVHNKLRPDGPDFQIRRSPPYHLITTLLSSLFFSKIIFIHMT